MVAELSLLKPLAYVKVSKQNGASIFFELNAALGRKIPTIYHDEPEEVEFGHLMRRLIGRLTAAHDAHTVEHAMDALELERIEEENVINRAELIRHFILARMCRLPVGTTVYFHYWPETEGMEVFVLPSEVPVAANANESLGVLVANVASSASATQPQPQSKAIEVEGPIGLKLI